MEKRREFGSWLQQKRQEAGLSQRQVARKLGFQSSGSVVGYENAISPVPLKRIFDLAEIYDIPMPEMVEKLHEYEPRIAQDFEDLFVRFGRYQLWLMSHRPASPLGIPHEIRAHHAPFQLSGYFSPEGPESDNVRNVNKVIYIMSTILSETATHQKNPPRITKTAHLLQITPQTTKGPGNPFFAQGAPYYVEYRGNAGLLN